VIRCRQPKRSTKIDDITASWRRSIMGPQLRELVSFAKVTVRLSEVGHLIDLADHYGQSRRHCRQNSEASPGSIMSRRAHSSGGKFKDKSSTGSAEPVIRKCAGYESE
jgi:hypothetical protein